MNRHGTKRAVAVLVWFGDKVMLTKRIGTKYFKDHWAAVGGSVDDTDESIVKAAMREMLEETGVCFFHYELNVIDCYQEDDFKCFIFECKRADYLFSDIKNTEPKKHSPWQLFTIKEALALPSLMPALREYLTKLLTQTQVKRKKKV